MSTSKSISVDILSVSSIVSVAFLIIFYRDAPIEWFIDYACFGIGMYLIAIVLMSIIYITNSSSLKEKQKETNWIKTPLLYAISGYVAIIPALVILLSTVAVILVKIKYPKG